MFQRIISDAITQACCSTLAQKPETYMQISCILSGVEWQFRIDVSGQLIGHIFKGQVVQQAVGS
jgi:hypothetical protein